MVVPDLHRIDAMPVRAFAACQQKVDRRRGGAPTGVSAAVPERLAKMPAFGMRLEIELADDLGRGERVHGGNSLLPANRTAADCPPRAAGARLQSGLERDVERRARDEALVARFVGADLHRAGACAD